jgi:hypothetical protein
MIISCHLANFAVAGSLDLFSNIDFSSATPAGLHLISKKT